MDAIVCLVRGCGASKTYYKNYCSKHYQQARAGKTLEQMQVAEVTDDDGAIPPPPKPPTSRKRCRAKMKNGSRCILPIKVAGMCKAHWKEERDREEFALREHPIVGKSFEFKGNEAALIARLESRHNV